MDHRKVLALKVYNIYMPDIQQLYTRAQPCLPSLCPTDNNISVSPRSSGGIHQAGVLHGNGSCRRFQARTATPRNSNRQRAQEVAEKKQRATSCSLEDSGNSGRNRNGIPTVTEAAITIGITYWKRAVQTSKPRRRHLPREKIHSIWPGTGCATTRRPRTQKISGEHSGYDCFFVLKCAGTSYSRAFFRC